MRRSARLWVPLLLAVASIACSEGSLSGNDAAVVGDQGVIDAPTEASAHADSALAPDGGLVDGEQQDRQYDRPPGPVPRRAVRFDPIDVVTAVGQVTPGVTVEDPRYLALGEVLLADLASRVSLLTWPELEPVAATVQTRDFAGTELARVELHPTMPLEDRWYVTRLRDLPSGLSWPPFPDYHALSDGSFGARFRPTTGPVLWGVRVCESSPGYSVIIGLSELVQADRPVTEIVRFHYAGGAGPAWSIRGEAADTDGNITLDCPSLDVARTLVLDLGDGLRSASGAALRDALGRNMSYSFSVTSLPQWGTGCRRFRDW